MEEPYDLIIIGGGPTGINVGISAKKAGLKYLILEKGVIVNSLYNFPVNMTFFSTSQKLEIHNMPFISDREKPTRRESLEYYRRLVKDFDLNLHLYEKVVNMHPVGGGGYRINTEKSAYTTFAVCIATGFYDTPRLMNVPGEELPKVRHYYDDPHEYINCDVLVVGAANSACDAALECWQKGANVTMAIRENEISDRVKYWIKPNIENRIKQQQITAYFNTEVLEIRPTEVDLQTPGGKLTIPNDFVLAMTGYQPNSKLLQQLGFKIHKDEDVCQPIIDHDTLETTQPNVYMAGVVCAGLKTSTLFIENTRDHGDIIVSEILKSKSSK